MKASIKYSSGYKYRLEEDVCVPTLVAGERITGAGGGISLEPDGSLLVKSGYLWDGPSGPTIDTASSMRASLAHDALYDLIRQGVLSEQRRAACDETLRRLCVADGMHRVRAFLWWVAVRLSGARFAKKSGSPTQ